MGACQLLARWLTPAEPNVNLAHRVWEGWEWMFPSYPWYVVMIYSVAIAVFAAIEWLILRIDRRADRQNE
jgi:hypothetical protein